jgi:PHD/YefM family antitoxin component YafN of YafNO toxin-antitoxin module
MKPIHKKIVIDESMRPVAVLIDYQDWQAIEKIIAAHEQQNPASTLTEFAGTIQLTTDPLEYQQQTRDGWL